MKTRTIIPMAMIVVVISIVAVGVRGSAGAMTVGDLQGVALVESPKIRAMEKEAAMMKKKVPQSSSLDDPKLKFGLNNIPTDNFSFKEEDMTSIEIGVSQMFPLWGKLGAKERIALKEYQKSMERLREEKIMLLHDIRMSAYEVIYAREALKIMNDIKSRLKLVIDSEVAAAKAGTGNLANVVKANVEYSMMEEEIIDLRQMKIEAEQKIFYLTGKRFKLEIDDMPDPSFAVVDADALKAEIAEANPTLRALKIDFMIARDEVALKLKEYLPDVELGVSYMFRNPGPDGPRSHMISGMVTMNVPLWFWKKNGPMVEEMRIKSSAAAELYKDKQNELEARTEVIVGRMKKWSDLYSLYKNTLVPQTELALEVNLGRYKTSIIEFMPLIDTMRLLLRYKKEILNAKKEYNSALSELHSLAGKEVLP